MRDISKLAKENLCFKPTEEFLSRIENYMAINHITDKSEAMRKICHEWAENKRDLETLRDYIRTIQPQQTAPSRLKLKECPMTNRTFATLGEQEYFCKFCKKRTPETYETCQSKGGEKGK